jgi:glycosyltransferase involved in cell wall biosynthesis
MTQPLREFAPISLPPLPERPLFSVLIRNHNYEQYVGAALDSVLAQTYGNFEIIVCDDGSTDNSRQVIQDYLRKDRRIRLVAQENAGATIAANTAYENCKGELIAWLDADDLFKPPKLERALAAFRTNHRCGLYANRIQPVSSAGLLLGTPFPGSLDHGWVGPAKLREGGCTLFPPMSGLSFRREVASLLFPIPLEMKRLEDYYLPCTAQFFTEIMIAPDCLTEYRVHGTNRSHEPNDGSSERFPLIDVRAHANFAERLEGVLPFQRDFLLRFYGPKIADTLRLEDHPGYWHVLLALRALSGRQGGMIRPYTVREMISHVRRPSNKRLWRAIMLLPDPFAKRAYNFWRSNSPLKRAMKSMLLPLIRR